MGGNPSRGMSFKAVSEELNEELLTYIGGDISVEEKVVVQHEDVLKIEKRRLGNDLTRRARGRGESSELCW